MCLLVGHLPLIRLHQKWSLASSLTEDAASNHGVFGVVAISLHSRGMLVSKAVSCDARNQMMLYDDFLFFFGGWLSALELQRGGVWGLLSRNNNPCIALEPSVCYQPAIPGAKLLCFTIPQKSFKLLTDAKRY